MTRDEYFDRCIKAAVKSGKHFGITDTPWEDEDLVSYDGKKYVPYRYVLGFDRKGRAVHSCELHDVKAKSIVRVRLEEVKNEE